MNTSTSLTQKERFLLEDQLSHEELCVKKYTNYASQAKDSELKTLFTTLASHEQKHYQTIDQILKGQVPPASKWQQSSQSQQTQTQQSQSQQPQPNKQGTGLVNQSDMDLCQDMLGTEKYISSAYNTAIFEFKNHDIRAALNHIQKEEQEHGEKIYLYMQSKGGYA